ncbi:unnamed protein product [Allacma fusca]|uniref:Uncharacterized protein n=1 Tax=Allacma fusca TaxID=39272 RepID=A0A8J2K1H1_9HEXA|nr:unnamed protein product [Allacma fusca]
MQEKFICCCVSNGWTRVIGWFQTILNAVGVLLQALNLLDVANYLREPVDLIANDGGASFLFDLTLFLDTIVATAMGLILLAGSIRLRPDLLRMWIYYACLHVTFIAIFLLMSTMYFHTTADHKFGIVIAVAILMLFHGFCLWIVQTHKTEIEINYLELNSKNSVDSAVL